MPSNIAQTTRFFFLSFVRQAQGGMVHEPTLMRLNWPKSSAEFGLGFGLCLSLYLILSAGDDRG